MYLGESQLAGDAAKESFGSYVHEYTHVAQSDIFGPFYMPLYYIPPTPFAAYNYFFSNPSTHDRMKISFMHYHSYYNAFERKAYMNAYLKSGYMHPILNWMLGI
jgi:hypothetical protein